LLFEERIPENPPPEEVELFDEEVELVELFDDAVGDGVGLEFSD